MIYNSDTGFHKNKTRWRWRAVSGNTAAEHSSTALTHDALSGTTGEIK